MECSVKGLQEGKHRGPTKAILFTRLLGRGLGQGFSQNDSLIDHHSVIYLHVYARMHVCTNKGHRYASVS